MRLGWRGALRVTVPAPALISLLLVGCATVQAPALSAYLERTQVPGAAATYAGQVVPAAAGERAVVQRLVGRTWEDLASGPLGPTGSYAISIPNPGRSTFTQRVVIRDAAMVARAASPASQYGSPPQAGVSPAIVNWLASRSGTGSVAIYDAASGITSVYSKPGANAGRYRYASTRKVDILGGVMRLARLQNRSITPFETSNMVPMIEQSIDANATNLWNELGGILGIHAYEYAVGAPDITQDVHWGLAETTPLTELALMEAAIWPNPQVRPADQNYGRYLMSHTIAAHRWGVNAGVPATAIVEQKNGWLEYGGVWNINSVGHVVAGDRNYVIAVMTQTPSSVVDGYDYGIATIAGVSRVLWGQNPSPSPAMRDFSRITPVPAGG